jgi:hypothetical protein
MDTKHHSVIASDQGSVAISINLCQLAEISDQLSVE